jgi:uncharacterized membrane protein
MSGPELGLAVSVFLACAVEAVEALTIVLAVGATRSWRSALYGAGAGTLGLAAVVAALGPALGAIPLGPLRVVVGSLLLVFGLQWLRKAILRAAGRKALHDEAAAFAQTSERARATGVAASARIDGYAFAIAAKAVLLEGLEVAFIALTFGTSQHHLGIAVIAAVLAVLVVAGTGAVLRAPLARVPENPMKFVVGVMLTAFGTFWSGEGAGARWPGNDASLPVLIAVFGVAAMAMVVWLRPPAPAPERA